MKKVNEDVRESSTEAGVRYGRLVTTGKAVIEKRTSPTSKIKKYHFRTRYELNCDCGKTVWQRKETFKNPYPEMSCGCYNKERVIAVLCVEP